MRLAMISLLLGLGGAPVLGEPDELERKLDALSKRVTELETQREEAKSAGSAASDWTRRFRLRGNAALGYYQAGRGDIYYNGERGIFRVQDFGLFGDAELGRDIKLGDSLVLRDAGLFFELSLLRKGAYTNDVTGNRVGELYADLQGLGDSGWTNLQAGRFHLPVGIEYLRYSSGRADNPFITHTVGGPWYWDEGLKLYGQGGKLGYVASVANGESAINTELDRNKLVTLRGFGDPTPWLHLSASGLYQGHNGSAGKGSNAGALWLGETFEPSALRTVGTAQLVQGGLAVPNAPGFNDETLLTAGDAVFKWGDRARLWLSYGQVEMKSPDPFYNRDLRYWSVEGIVEGRNLDGRLEPFYLGLRASGLGTYSAERGYLLSVNAFHYNGRSIEAREVVLGWRLSERMQLKAQYTDLAIDLVRGTDALTRSRTHGLDFYGLEFQLSF